MSLNFTKQKLVIRGQTIFYYDRNSQNERVRYYSQCIHQELKEYLGIQREIRLRDKMSQAITGEQKRYDEIKIHRIAMFYDYYIDSVLQMMQMLYYENFQYIITDSNQAFINQYKYLQQAGLKLQYCLDKALKICEDIEKLVKKQILEEFPVETFQDKCQQNGKK